MKIVLQFISEKNYLFIIGQYVPIVDKERGNKTRLCLEECNKLINEKKIQLLFTFVQLIISMYFNESTLLNFNDNKQIFSLCVSTIWSWLILHLCYTCFVTACVLSPSVLLLSGIGELLWTWHRSDHQRIEDISVYERDYSRFAQFRRYVLYELQLIFTYVSLAFVFTLMMNNHSVRWRTIFYWMIEASYVPHIFFFIFLSAYLDVWNAPYVIEFDSILTSPFGYMLKVTLFVWMRYVELYPSSRLNDYQTYFFYYYCDTSHIHHIPNDHLLRRWLRHL